jgi:hypothetical protein
MNRKFKFNLFVDLKDIAKKISNLPIEELNEFISEIYYNIEDPIKKKKFLHIKKIDMEF